MGRQICFYISEKDTRDLISLIYANGGILVDSRLNRLDEIRNDKAFVILPDSKLFFIDYSGEKVINQLTSEVIALNISRLINNGTNVSCGYEHGRFWCETKYFTDAGEKITKSDKFLSFFNVLKKYVVKNYKLSKNGRWYIAPDAYNKYLKGLFVPYSGKVVVEFEKNTAEGSVCSDEK